VDGSCHARNFPSHRRTCLDLQTVIAVISGEQLSSPPSEHNDTLDGEVSFEQAKMSFFRAPLERLPPNFGERSILIPPT